MHAAIEAENAANPSDHCTVVVIYDDNATRARSLAACDYLVQQTWQHFELDFHWWRTDFLSDPQLGEVAARQAIESDLLIVCFKEFGEIPPALEAWFENWIGRRTSLEGALIDLGDASSNRDQLSGRIMSLQEIARRGRFDLITTDPERSEEHARKPATFPLAGLPAATDDQVNRQRPPSHYGLND